MSTRSDSVEWDPAPRTPGRQLRVLEALDQARVQYYHISAVVIAGLGFFTDAYDFFVVGVVIRLLGRLYYPGNENGPGQLPMRVQLAVVSTALVGALTGQFIFGWLGDKLGRKKAYGITLTIMFIFSIASGLSVGTSPRAVLGSLCFFRFWLGVGIGGDYPLSATIMSEYANTETRGTFIAAVFAMQGFGILSGGFAGIILSAIFNARYHTKAFEDAAIGEHSTAPEADYLWRILFMLGAIPAALTFYYRMRMPETARYTALVTGDTKKAASDMMKVLRVPALELAETETAFTIYEPTCSSSALHYRLFSREFLKKHGRELLGTTTTWFLLDITYYSQNLLQSRIFNQIGWTPPATEMNGIEEVYRISIAQVLVAVCGTVPGYWVCVFLVDRIGRFVIQLQGFIFMGVCLFTIAIFYQKLETQGQEGVILFLMLYSLTFFFANFGPNTTTFIVPAELFPARLRATCHGISAAAGKTGSIVGVFGFLYATRNSNRQDDHNSSGIGLRNALYILAAVNFLGAACTAFLIPETNKKSLELLSGESKHFAPDHEIESTGMSVHPHILKVAASRSPSHDML